jgi:hypothetical protein
LAAFLDAALRLRALQTVEPRSALAAAEGRQRFLSQAAAMRKRHKETVGARLTARLASWYKGLDFGFSPVRRGLATSLVTIALLAAVLVGGAWGGLAVSANSLPGDTFYPVKRAGEQLQLWLAFNELTREELQQEFDQRRVEEAKTLIKERRPAAVTFKGEITHISDGVWVIDGMTVMVSSDVAASGEFADGVRVTVQGYVHKDGSLVAEKVTLDSQQDAKPVETATSTLVPSATYTLVPILPTATSLPTKTAEPTNTPLPSLTNTRPPEPTSTRSLTPTPSPTSTTRATATPTSRPIKLQVEGAVSRIAQDSWDVGGQTVLVDANTAVDKRGGNAEVGAWARVTAVRREDGALLALEIVIEQGASRPPELYEFQGVIEAFTEIKWTISGTTVRITADTVISGAPQVGRAASVRALRAQDGSLTATNITVKPEDIVQFEGVIESLQAAQWVVDGRTIQIASNTAIEGKPEIGAIAEIEAIQKTDGSLVARWIRVHPKPTPTVSPTKPAPSATPTRLPTGTPTSPALSATPTATLVWSTPTVAATLNVQPPAATATPWQIPARPTYSPGYIPHKTPPSLKTDASLGE